VAGTNFQFPSSGFGGAPQAATAEHIRIAAMLTSFFIFVSLLLKSDLSLPYVVAATTIDKVTIVCVFIIFLLFFNSL
jgi:hypothetical protein